MSEANEAGFVRDPNDSTHAMSAFILIKQMKDKSGPLAAIQSNASRAKYNMSLAGRCSRMCILFGYVLVPVVPDLSSSHSLLYVSDYVLTCQEFQEPPVVIPRLVTMGMVSTFRFLLLPRAHVTYPSFLRIAVGTPLESAGRFHHMDGRRAAGPIDMHVLPVVLMRADRYWHNVGRCLRRKRPDRVHRQDPFFE